MVIIGTIIDQAINLSRTVLSSLFFTSGTNADLSLRAWRERLLRGVLRGAFLLWLLALTIGVKDMVGKYWGNGGGSTYPLSLLMVILFVYLLSTALLVFITFKRELKYELRAGLLLFALFVLGTLGMALSSFSGEGWIVYFAFIVFTAVFFDLRYSLFAFGCTFLALLVLGYLQVSGEFQALFHVDPARLSAWFTRGIIFLTLSGTALLSITYLLQTFEHSLNETRSKALELSRLYEAAEEMAERIGEPKSLLESLARHMAEALQATSVNILSIDAAQGTMSVLAEYWSEQASGLERTSDLGRVYSVKDYITIMRSVIAGKAITIHKDTEILTEAERRQFDTYGVQSMLFIPIMAHGQLFGDAEIWESRHRREFTEAEVRMVQAMASHAAAIIESTQLFIETNQRKNELAALLSVSKAVSSTLEVKDVLKVAATSLARILQADYCTLSEYDPRTNSIQTIALYPPDGEVDESSDKGVLYTLEDYPTVSQVFRTNQPVVVRADDPMADPKEVSLLLEAEKAVNLMIPLAAGGHLLGIAEVYTSDVKREFDPAEIELARALADQIAVAIENARLYAQVEEREAYYRALIENSAEGFAILEVDGTVRYLAPSEERITGYLPEEVVGKSAFQYIHPEDLPAVLQVFQEGVKDPGTVRSVTYRLLHKKDGWHHFEIIGRNLLHDPRIAGIVVIYRDITERKIAEKAMVDSEERYRTIFQTTSIPIWEDDYSELMNAIEGLKEQGVTDFRRYLDEHPDFLKRAAKMIKIMDANNAAVQMMEACDKAELMGALGDVLKENPNDAFAKDVLALAEGVTHLEHETFLHTLKGNRRDVLVSLTLPQWSGGYSRVLVSTLDITERKQAERALEESRSRLEGIINTALNAIITIDKDQRIVLFNPFAEKTFGCPANYALGKPIDVFIPDRFRSYHRENIARFGETNVSSRVHGRLDSLYGRRITGEEFPMEAFISQHGFGNEKFYTVILQDITERKQAEDTLKRRADELQTLVIVSSALRTAISVSEIIPLVVRHAVNIVGGDLGTVYLLEESTGNLISPGWYSVEQGEDIKVRGEAVLRHVSYKGITGHVAQTGQIYITEDLHNDPLAVILPLEAETLRSARSGISLPLLSREKVVGVLHIRLQKKHIFTETETRLLTAIAEMAGSAIQRAKLYEQTHQQADELAQAYDSTLTGWARALELRDELTEGHTRRVTELTLELAGLFNIPENDMTQIRRGAILHDIGKMGIPDSILHKPGPLTARELRIMQMHTEYAHEMLSFIPFLRSALDIPYCHHERWDGTGYPRGLKGEQIPLAARIFSVVDVWDALTSDRPYRSAWSKEKARDYILVNSGTQFDPRIVEKFIALLEDRL